MTQEGIELTHDDIWDDSALVDSWNEALDEYKKYHSIHASGGKLEDLPEYQKDDSAEAGPDLQPAALTSDQGQAYADNEPKSHDPQLQAQPVAGAEGTESAAQESINEGVVNGGSNTGAGAGAGQGLTGGMPMPPQALLGSMQDEGLKRLLMSWYYAGYYTGLYEGQQQKP